MKNLPPEVKRLVNLGIYSMYTIEGSNCYWLHVPAAPPCCNLHPHPAYDYRISPDGDVLDHINPESTGLKAGQLIRFIPLE